MNSSWKSFKLQGKQRLLATKFGEIYFKELGCAVLYLSKEFVSQQHCQTFTTSDQFKICLLCSLDLKLFRELIIKIRKFLF